MPFLPFAATVGAALGGSATLGGLAIAGAGATAAGTISSGVQASKQAKSANSAANDALLKNAAAVQSVKDAQTNASTQAQSALDTRRRSMAGSQTIFTSPLGLTQQATTAKKTLLGQ